MATKEDKKKLTPGQNGQREENNANEIRQTVPGVGKPVPPERTDELLDNDSTSPASANTFMSTDDILKHIERTKPESDEDRRKRERREKWEGIIGGIADAASSLGNLYFTTQYAPNMYDAQNSMTAKAKERFEKAKAERDARLKEHINYSLRYNELKDAEAGRLYKRERDKITDQLREREIARKEALDAWKAEKDRLELEIRQAQNTGNNELAQKKIDELVRHNLEMERLTGIKIYTNADSKTVGEFKYNGKNYKNQKAMWDAMDADARELDVDPEEFVDTGKVDRRGRPTQQRRRKRDADLEAEINEARRKKEEEKNAGNRRKTADL